MPGERRRNEGCGRNGGGGIWRWKRGWEIEVGGATGCLVGEHEVFGFSRVFFSPSPLRGELGGKLKWVKLDRGGWKLGAVPGEGLLFELPKKGDTGWVTLCLGETKELACLLACLLAWLVGWLVGWLELVATHGFGRFGRGVYGSGRQEKNGRRDEADGIGPPRTPALHGSPTYSASQG